jgi:NAD(P)H-hydrate epimerase
MIPVVTAQQMQELDRLTSARYGIPSLLLMEHAGTEAVREMAAAFPDLARSRLVVLCGRGNNGGDGFVIARHLLDDGAQVETYLLASRDEVKGDARTNLEILEKLGAGPREIRDPAQLSALGERLATADVLVDALLGTGTRGPAQGLLAQAIELLNAAGRPVVAVDIPSGLAADLAEVPGPAVRARLTVTFALPKRCLLLYPAAACAGSVRIVDIGIPSRLRRDAGLRLHLLEAQDAAAAFPVRDPAAHKGTFGHVLVIAGSMGKTGAATLCGLAAQRVGAGLVTVAVPRSLNDILEVKLTEVMTVPVPETEERTVALEALEPLRRLVEGKSAVALGPGLGTHPSTRQCVREFLATCQVPVVLDADGLNALAGEPDFLRRVAGPLVLTPHPGELSRLLGVPREEILGDRVTVAQDLATRLRVTLVLKLARTIVADATGGATINPTGNPGMASGGTGDVLTGLIAGLLGQGREPTLAARAGVYLHGLAGDLAARALGEEPLLASDLLERVPEAIRHLKASGLKTGTP